MVNIARANEDLPVGFFSMEMPKASIAERMMQIEYNRSRWELKPDVRIDPQGFKTIFTGRFPAVRIFGGVYGVDEVKALIKKHELRVAFIDFLGLMRPRDASASLYAQATQKITELKQAAKDSRALIILLVQLSRAAGDGSSPVTVDMARDSGAIEELSDFILGLWDPSLAEDAAMAWKNRLVIALLKNKRSGPRQITCHFDRTTGRILEEAEESHD
jgi:replicative DNA helicase